MSSLTQQAPQAYYLKSKPQVSCYKQALVASRSVSFPCDQFLLELLGTISEP